MNTRKMQDRSVHYETPLLIWLLTTASLLATSSTLRRVVSSLESVVGQGQELLQGKVGEDA